MRAIAIALLLAGVSFMVLGYSHEIRTQEAPPPRVEVRYVPRSFEEEQLNLPKPSDLFRGMFEEGPVGLRV